MGSTISDAMQTSCTTYRGSVNHVSLFAETTRRDDTTEMFGKRLKEKRDAKGLSQEQLGLMVGYPKSTAQTRISNYEKGMREPTLSEIDNLALVLDTSPAELAFSLDAINQLVAMPRNAVTRSGLVDIPQMNVWGSMGNGAIPPDHVEAIQVITARISELSKQCTFTSPGNLQIITGYGRSMLPTFGDGDPLLVDVGVQTVEIDAIYVFSIGEDLFIKALQRIPGNGLRAISHNRTEFESWNINAEQMERMKIHGRVILAWNARRL